MATSAVTRAAWLVLLAATASNAEDALHAPVLIPQPPAPGVLPPPPADPHAAVLPPPPAPPAQTSPTDEDFELSHGVPQPEAAPFVPFPFNPQPVDPHAADLALGAHGDPHGDVAHGEEAHGEAHGEEAHGDAHGGHGHGNAEGNAAVSFTASACLLGMVTSFHLLFYLVNCKYKLVRAMTWKLASSTVSIFIAVLLWGVIHSIHHAYVAPTVGWIDIPHVPCLMFILMWCVNQVLLFFWKDNMTATATISMLGAHMTGFCAIHAFGLLQEHEYNSTPSTALICGVLFAAVVTVLAQIWINIRRIVALAGDGKIDDEEKHWFEKCQEFEDEVVALVMGFLIAQCVRFAAVGRFVSDHEAPTETQGASKMLLAGLLFLVATIGMTILRGSMKHMGKMIDRVMGVTQHVFGLTSAWCNMFGLKRWIVASLAKELDSLMVAMMVMAMFDTMLAAGTVIILQQVVANFQVNAKVLRSIISAVALLVGLAWEKTFHHAIHAIAHSGRVDADEEHATIKLSLCLATVVLPAWKWHILPKADHRLAKQVANEEEDNDDSVAKLADESEPEEEEDMDVPMDGMLGGGQVAKREMFVPQAPPQQNWAPAGYARSGYPPQSGYGAPPGAFYTQTPQQYRR